MNRVWKRWMAIALAVVLVGSSGIFTWTGALEATEEEVAQVSEEPPVEEPAAEPVEEAPQEILLPAEGETPVEVEGEAPAQAEGEAPAQAEGEASAQAEGEVPAQAEGEASAQAEGEAPAQAEAGTSAEAEAKTPAGTQELEAASSANEAAAEEASEVTEEATEEEKEEEASEEEEEETSEEEEAEEKEEKYPAASVTARASDGAVITVSAPEGALPEGFGVTAVPVSSDHLIAAIEAAENAQVVKIVSYDITIYDKEGREIQPLIPVNVSLSGTGLEGSASVYHTSDGASDTSRVATVSDGNNPSFTAGSFSTWTFTQTRRQEEPKGVTAQKSTHPLYLYTLLPGLKNAGSGNANEYWNGMGEGSITAIAPFQQVLITDVGTPIVPMPQFSLPGNYPSITSEGESYTYASGGTAAGTYTITWDRVVVANGANAGYNNYNRVVPSGTYTYHLDGHVTLHSVNYAQVDFKVQQPESADFTQSKSVRVETGTRESDVRNYAPSMEEKNVSGISYTFDGWYRDEACTEKVNWSRQRTIDSNTVYYGKYVPESSSAAVTVTAASASRPYDGRALTNDQISWSGLPAGYTAEAKMTAESTITNEGTVRNRIDSYVIRNGNGQDVTNFFTNVNKVDGTLTVTPAPLTVRSESGEKKYDGTPLTKAGVTVEGLVGGETLTAVATGSQTVVGSSANQIELTWDGTAKEDNYTVTTVEGKLTVTPLAESEKAELTVRAADGLRTYNGEEQSVTGLQGADGAGVVTVSVGDVSYKVSGLSASGSGKDAGSYPVIVTGTALVEDAQGNDVTDQFRVVKEEGTLTIGKKTVTLTSGSASKQFDGTALKEETVSEEGFVQGEGAVYSNFAERTLFGSTENTFTYTLKDNTKAENYDINVVCGRLTITVFDRVTVYITGNSGTFTYDGTEKSVSGYTVTVSDEGRGYSEADFTFTGTAAVSGTQPGTYHMGLTAAMFENTNENFDNVKFVVTDGGLTVEPIQEAVVVTLRGNSATFTYDGTQKSVSGYEVVSISHEAYTANDFVYNGTAEVTATEAGEDYPMGLTAEGFVNTNDNFANVTFVVEDGSLTIEKRAITVKARNAYKVYDGTPLEAPAEVDVVYEGATGLLAGHTVEAEVTGSVTNVVDSPQASVITENSIYIRDAQGSNVSANYIVTREEGTLTIKQRQIILVSATDTKEFDGTPLTRNTQEDVWQGTYGDGWLGTEKIRYAFDESASITYPASVTGIESVDNTFTVVNEDGSEFKDSNYNIGRQFGTLSVTEPEEKQILTVTANSDTFLFDGSEKRVTGLVSNTVTVETAKGDVTYTVEGVTTVGTGTDAGTYEVLPELPDNHRVLDAQGTDVTGLFEVLVRKGSLTIEKRKVILTSPSITKVYDGAPITGYDTVTVTGDGWAPVDLDESQNAGGGIKYWNFAYNGTDADVMRMENGFDYEIANKPRSNPEFDSYYATNYDIEYQPGILEITSPGSVVVEITGNTDTVSYTGKEQSVSGYDIRIIQEDGGAYTEEDLQVTVSRIEASASGTDVGEYPMGLTADAFRNVNPNFKDVEIRVTDGKLTVQPARVLVEIDGRHVTEVYDGWTKGVGYDVTISYPDGTPATEYTEADFERNVSWINQTYPGSWTFPLDIVNFKNINTNYDVEFRTTDGSLTILKRPITLRSIDISYLDAPKDTVFTPVWADGMVYVAEGSFVDAAWDESAGIKYTMTGNVSRATSPGENTFEVTDESGRDFLNKNYIVTKEYGVLTVEESYQLTVNYVYSDGSQAAEPFTGLYGYNETVSVDSPVIEGYTYDISRVEAVMTGDMVLTVTYLANPVPVPVPTDPADPVDPVPPVDPADPADPVPPVEPGPEPDPVVPPAVTPVTPDPVPVPPTPVAVQATVDDAGNVELVTIEDTETPLADIDLFEHFCNILPLLFMLGAMLIMLFYTKDMKAIQVRIFELREKLEDDEYNGYGR
ncbi:MAG: hypothetical protein IJC59_01100 [Lachnospiraceae bacterium]|nr:hypothetical protein [Lachnospiraceae bacterium]